MVLDRCDFVFDYNVKCLFISVDICVLFVLYDGFQGLKKKIFINFYSWSRMVEKGEGGVFFLCVVIYIIGFFDCILRSCR